MLPGDHILEEARKARDPRFDGRFFIGVRTTGIYCRPVCPVKLPRQENVSFFDSAAAASEAGYRPCLRCRPEASPGTPAWLGTSTTVKRALRLINEGALDDGSIGELSDRLGVTRRHLNRLFIKHLGASPNTIAQTRRLQFAKRLIDETNLSMTEIAMAAGYGSIRRFNDHFKRTYKASPSGLRRAGSSSKETVELKLAFREPYDFEGLLDFYGVRATPGVEAATDGRYVRNFMEDGEVGRVTVMRVADKPELICEVQGGSPRSLMNIVERVRRMFDVDAIPEEINRILSGDKELRRIVKRNRGQRIPGAFDEFEVAVRAIVGQQVSVKGATTVMGRIVAQYGTTTGHGAAFPSPEQLAELDPESLPMPVKRAVAIRTLSQTVAEGKISLSRAQDADECQAALQEIPGIGPWTAQYIAMRALGDPDAFLHGDLVLKKVAAAKLGIESESELIERAERWRPWRGYAGMHLWRIASEI